MSALLVEREFAPQREVFTLRNGERLAQRCRVSDVAAPKILQLGRQSPHWRRLSRGALVGGRGASLSLPGWLRICWTFVRSAGCR